MKRQKVLCVLPVYNAEKYLFEAVSSILNQTYSDFRFLIIDDGSTDSSSEIIKSFKDSRIQVISNNGNKGLIFSLNLSLNIAEEDFLIRMDADDIAEPERFEKLVGQIEKDDSLIVLGSQVNYFGNESGVSRLPRESNEINAFLFFRNPVAHPTVIIRMSFIRQHALTYEPIFLHAEDYRLWTSVVISGGKMENVGEALLKYRIEGQNISIHNFQKSIWKSVLIWKDYFSFYGYYPSEKGIIMHGILAGIWGIDSFNCHDFFIYAKSFRDWLSQSDIAIKPFLMRQYEDRMNQLFFTFCKTNPWLIVDFWIFRKKIKMPELKYLIAGFKRIR